METKSALVFDELFTRRVDVGTIDGSTEVMLGITIAVMRHLAGGMQGPEKLPEILVPLRLAKDLPQAIQSALAKQFPQEPSEPTSTDRH